MALVPTPRLDVVQVATPGLPAVTLLVPQPVFELHVTVPVTVCELTPECPLISPYCPLIVAVNVTDCPKTEGFKPEVTTVAALAAFTTCPPDNVAVLVRKLLLPEYTAVTVCVPWVSVEVLPEVAEPATSVTGDPKLLPSTENCTVPLGVPAPGAMAATVAVKLTACP